jgi:hypothetical protein
MRYGRGALSRNLSFDSLWFLGLKS